jgi:hypothetical protein
LLGKIQTFIQAANILDLEAGGIRLANLRSLLGYRLVSLVPAKPQRTIAATCRAHSKRARPAAYVH